MARSASPSSLPPLSLDDQLCFALYSASMAVGRLYKPLLDEMGITYPQFLVLTALNDEGTLTVGGLGARLALEPSTITPLVKRLEVAGLVQRKRGLKDERQVEVSLTEAGADIIARTPCLAEALLAKAGMTVSDLKGFKAQVQDFGARIAAAAD
ncbi:MAG: MarR family transcriptional regulator [Brevundimonas sp.]|nr:MAG: MarR family transcriptional regulator [Brevundimonas sp.]